MTHWRPTGWKNPYSWSDDEPSTPNVIQVKSSTVIQTGKSKKVARQFRSIK